MPYTTPTVDQFTARFAIFADKDPDLIQALLNEAAGRVDTSWIEADYQPAIMYLAAHLLATDNSDEGDDPEIGGASSGVIASENFGGMGVSYVSGGNTGTLSSSDQYGTTVYGRRFLAYLRANKPGIVAV